MAFGSRIAIGHWNNLHRCAANLTQEAVDYGPVK
jgi:hypothetical protein